MRLDLGYDGTHFSGWARQPGRRTVQGELESALATVLRLDQPPSLTVAGRTDAGVHARGQVAHLDVRPLALSALIKQIGATRGTGGCAYLLDHGVERADGAGVGRLLPSLTRSLNGVLPADIVVAAASFAPAGFDARFSALGRRYSYRVADGWADPLRRHDTLAYPRALDLDAMNAASEMLLGEHDFAAFCRRREGATTVRGLLAFNWTRDEAGVAVARVEADAFCHSMVRSLVGALLAVGDGRRDVAWPGSLLDSTSRESGVTVVAPHGLTLEEVRYPDDEMLASRADQTRRRRDDGGCRRNDRAADATTGLHTNDES
ncbi:MAG: tRNA pseudouridine(38-40) synthase TruA [Gaiellaceae bacterium]